MFSCATCYKKTAHRCVHIETVLLLYYHRFQLKSINQTQTSRTFSTHYILKLHKHKLKLKMHITLLRETPHKNVRIYWWKFFFTCHRRDVENVIRLATACAISRTRHLHHDCERVSPKFLSASRAWNTSSFKSWEPLIQCRKHCDFM